MGLPYLDSTEGKVSHQVGYLVCFMKHEDTKLNIFFLFLFSSIVFAILTNNLEYLFHCVAQTILELWSINFLPGMKHIALQSLAKV